ncbi:TetR/AcrR family transcriptional regulator [Brooklawnia cerclae]
MRERIAVAAREELAATGASGLSMRRVAARVGVTVGALYRYYADRDQLLTGLIIEAYLAIGQAAESGERSVGAPAERWLAIFRAVRDWAKAHPHQFDLIYGSPVVGYIAPETTIGPATRILAPLIRTALTAPGRVDPSPVTDAGLASDLDRVRGWLSDQGYEVDPGTLPDSVILGVLRAWTELVGTIGHELHGHFVGSIEHTDDYLDEIARRTGQAIGL